MGIKGLGNQANTFGNKFVKALGGDSSGTDAVGAAPLPSGLTATGGVISDYTDGPAVYRAHIFTSSGTFDVTAPGTLGDTVEYLVVAGGGSGPHNSGGGAGGGMAPLGGGGGGEMGGGEMGGGAPIAPGGAPGAMGGAPAAPTGMGDASMATQIPQVTAEVANPQEFGGKVLKKKNRDRVKSEQQKMYHAQSRREEKFGVTGGDGQTRDEKGQIIFTKAERNLIPLLTQAQHDGLLKDCTIYPQFRVPCANTEYSLDFAIPQLKIGIEADGEIFHSAPKQIQHDQERDMRLQQQGWTILRYSDSEIEMNSQKVQQDIVRNVMQKQMWLQEQTQEKKS